MLLKKELKEIRKIIENSNDPLYLFDDDGDGLCSYLVLKKHFKKGRGKPIKKPGPLDNFYLDYIDEGKPDLIIILDKPLVKQSFIDEVPCPVIYIDHHPLQNLKNLGYFNPLKHKKKVYIPTSEIVYSVTNDSLWIATVGSLFDYKIPYFIKEFKKQYKDLLTKIPKNPGYIKFETRLGELIKVFAYNIKGKKSEVKKSVQAFEKVESPYEILNKTTEHGKFLQERYERFEKQYQQIIKEAKKTAGKSNILVFEHPQSVISFTSELSTELSYWYPNKTIIIIKEKDNGYKMSIRHQKVNVREIFEKSIEGIKGHGGGHERALGAFIERDDFERFLENFRNNLKKPV